MSPEQCRRLFPSLSVEVGGVPANFFDGPGGTQVPAAVIEAMAEYLSTSNANAYGPFVTSQRTVEVIARARLAVSNLLGAGSDYGIAFGANMTSLCFSLARAIGRSLHPGDEILVTDLDHEANRAPWLTLTELGIAVRSVPVIVDECRLDIEALERMVTDRTRVVAVSHASNAVGTVTDVQRVVALARAAGAVSVIDSVHYVPHEAVDVDQLGCDFLLFSVYKVFGPHVGVLCGRTDTMAELRFDRVRCQTDVPPAAIETGTLNHEGLAGTIAAVEFIAGLGGSPSPTVGRHWLVRGMQSIQDHERTLGERLEAGLASIPGIKVYGPPKGHPRVSTYSFTARGMPASAVAKKLGEAGIFVWSGHFYAQTLIEKLGLSDQGGLVRIGLAPYNTVDEVDRLLSVVCQTVSDGNGMQG